jgi:predicted thioesterase
MLALMEAAAVECLAVAIDASLTTVGTSASIHHLAASPLGQKVRLCAFPLVSHCLFDIKLFRFELLQL